MISPRQESREPTINLVESDGTVALGSEEKLELPSGHDALG